MRAISMKPCGLPIALRSRCQHAPIFQRHDLLKSCALPLPVLEDGTRARAARCLGVAVYQAPDQLLLFPVFERFELDHIEIAAFAEVAGLIQDESDTSAHSCSEVTAGL